MATDGSPSLTAVLTGIGEFKLETRTTSPPGPKEVQIKIGAVGICGSDLAYFRDGVAGGLYEIDFSEEELAQGYKGQLGHEAAGEVVACGSEVTKVKVGDRVALEAGVPCLECKVCRTGRYNLCPDVKFLGSYVNRTPGTLTELFNWDSRFVYVLPDSVSLEEGAMLEPLSVAISAVRRGKVAIGDRVLVTGAGPVGLLTMMVASSAGATVVVTDVVPSKLEMALSLGAVAVVDMRDSDAADKALEGGKFDVSIECSGATPALKAAVGWTKSGGNFVVVANQKSTSTEIPLQDLCRREITLTGVYRYTNTWPAALNMVASGKLAVQKLITHRFSLEDTAKAFETFQAGDAIKVMIGSGVGSSK